jgi:hypothetical protein
MQHQLAVRTILAVSCLVFFSAMLVAQSPLPENLIIPRHGNIKSGELQCLPDHPTTISAPRGYAKYTAKDWRRLIDSTWGPGLPTDQKLQIFDGFWNNVDQYYGGFPNLNVNWDSLKSVYRPEVASGVSRGRFCAIMSYMSLALRTHSTFISDLGIDSAWSVAGKWRPRGIPLLNLSDRFETGLGARLTSLPDSSLLVLQALPNHPLGLQAGDIVLGYDRVPWKQLIRQLMDAQLPLSSRYNNNSCWPSSPEGWQHNLLNSAGVNWYLFDSIDVVKYSTGQTVHLPTSKLDVTDWDTFMAFEEIPVKGVPFPVYGPLPADIKEGTWGIVDGTNVGYIYIHAWDQNGSSGVTAGIRALTQAAKTDGLIIDLRFNYAGSLTYLSSLDALFSSDPSSSISFATRTGTDKMSFTFTPFTAGIVAKHQLYDRPIAVLTGPECLSAGDYSAFLLRGHPMVRFFGKPTSTSYADGNYVSGYSNGNLWYYQVSKGQGYSNYPGEGFLTHKGFDVDERIWFTKDDAAKGDDTIVKRALQWIAEVSHGHDVTLLKTSGKPARDTIKVKATVENPQKHTLSVWSYITDRAGVTVDSCQMFDDGLHYDGAAGDKVYGGSIRPPAKETTFDIALRTTDVTAGTFRKLSRTCAYFTNGPVVSKGWRSSTTDTIPNPGDILRLRFPLVSMGTTDTVRSVTATVSTLDTMVLIGSSVQISYGDMIPGVESIGSTTQAMRIQSYCPPNTKVRLLISIVSEGVTAWTDTVTLLVQASATEVAENNIVPKEYSLSQNYPNPFNPSTSFEFRVPSFGLVSLKVFDALGREVATLVNEVKTPGVYRLAWEAGALPSGVYFYRLTAGSFTDTKKLVLLR